MNIYSCFFNRFIYEFKNSIKLIKKQPILKTIFIAISALLIELFLVLTFYSGFDFLYKLGSFGLVIIIKLFPLMFMSLGIMLVFSGIITSYSSIFKSKDLDLLMTMPIPFKKITIIKHFQSTLLASWSFYFIITPFILAYTIFEKLPISFILWTFILSLPFILICTSISTIIILLITYLFPKLNLKKYITAVLIILIFLLFKKSKILLSLDILTNAQNNTQLSLNNLIPGLSMASNILLPSSWLTEGILSIIKHNFFRGLMFVSLLFSTSFVLLMLVEFLGNILFYKITNLNRYTKKKNSNLFIRVVDKLFVFLPPQIKAIVTKDIKTFFRDPSQWAQSLIFFGLLGLYFINIKNFKYNEYPLVWRNLISFLNIFSISAVITSLASRFMYPQLSLEGQSYWVLNFSPVSPKKLILTKFFINALTIMFISILLICISVVMLDMPTDIFLISIALVCLIAIAVSALSIGLGCIFIDLEKNNPSQIVSGFGGTLNLIICLAFIILTILPFSVLYHLNYINVISTHLFNITLIITFIFSLILTLLAVIIPLGLGIKEIETRDF